MGSKRNITVDTLGMQRVVVASKDGKNALRPLPQGAWKLDNQAALLHASETILNVHLLELDSTSMKQLRAEHKNDTAAIAEAIKTIIRERGKMHNPITNSGGVMIATIQTCGTLSPHKQISKDELIVPLCSISAIPLAVSEILSINENQVAVRGHAVLFAPVKVAVVPKKLDPRIALSAIDVSRMLPQLKHTVQSTKPRTVAVLGCGNAGLTSLAYIFLMNLGIKMVAFDVGEQALHNAKELNTANTIVAKLNLQDAVGALEARAAFFDGRGADLVLNCVSVDQTEAASTILCCEKGTIVYFSMATSFGRAVLSTDPVGAEVSVVCGAGVFASQGTEAFGLLERHYPLRRIVALQRGVYHWMPTMEHFTLSNMQRILPLPLRDEVEWSRDPHEWYRRLHDWSISQLPTFWNAVWDATNIVGDKGGSAFASSDTPCIRSPRFFPQAAVNLAENLLQVRASHPHKIAIVARSENDVVPRRTWTYEQLYRASFQAWKLLCDAGVKKGDRVAGILPNIPETVAFMLATTALGAVWTALSPDCGETIALQRIAKIEPTMLIGVREYPYNGKIHTCAATVEAVSKKLRQCTVVFVSYISTHPNDFVADVTSPLASQSRMTFTRISLQDPMYILFTSGTTGSPKAITQGFGVHLNHLKETFFHFDLKQLQETVFIYTTCGWMLWHELMSTLHFGSSLVLYDGASVLSSRPTEGTLWKLCSEEHVTYFGTGARYLEHTLAHPQALTQYSKSSLLSKLQLVTSTGSTLSDSAARFVMGNLSHTRVTSISGGTELNGCLVANTALLPVNAAELQCAPLGMDVDVVDAKGQRVQNTQGELVCFTPFPSMPLYFWGEPDDERYKSTYFDMFGAHIWAHGDIAARVSGTGGFRIHGRSDATLNPGGVRLGTSEYYEVLSRLPGIKDSLVVDIEDYGVVLFVVGDEQIVAIRDVIRKHLTPKHVPKDVVFVGAVPYNKNNKKLEVLVKRIIEQKPEHTWKPMLDHLQDRAVLEPFFAYRDDKHRPVVQRSKI